MLSHIEPVSLTILLSSLRASLASQQPDRLIQGSLCYTRACTSNHLRRSRWSTCNNPKFVPYIQTLIFSCLANNTLLILLWKLYYIVAHPPLGARWVETEPAPRGCSNSSHTLSSVTLSQVPSQLAISSFRRQPPIMVFGSAYGRIASFPYPLFCTLKMRTARSNFSFLSAWHK